MIQSNQVVSGVDSCGARLQHARVAAGLSHEDVASRLKMPVRVVRALESDDWSPLGAPVFVRGQLRSYARLLRIDLDVDSELAQAHLASGTPPALVSHNHTPRYQRVFEQLTRRVVYIAITAAIAVPVWVATRPQLANQQVAVQSLDVSPASAAGKAVEPDARLKPVPVERTPMAASMTPISSRPVEISGLSFTFSGDSWVQVFARDGGSLKQGMLGAGDSLKYDKGQVGRVVLGDTSSVEVRQAGKPVDLSPFSRANVARFTLSSDGSLAPVSD
ncbi:MAG: DUF4115 domain-containing protein [Pseudomonadota bacterium]|nr:DUF4115 domain-containing protein [Pseudomonadota bacterium]